MTDEFPDDPIFTDAERQIIRTVERSKIWRLMRDALALERERVVQREVDPTSPNLAYLLGRQDGERRQINRLLREGPHLAVYYSRYRAEQEAKGLTNDIARPGGDETPEL